MIEPKDQNHSGEVSMENLNSPTDETTESIKEMFCFMELKID